MLGNLYRRFHHHFCLAFPSTVPASPSLGLVSQIAAPRRTFFLPVLCSDESFTPERIRGSGSSKGTTGSDSEQKERIRGTGFMMNPRNRIRNESSESDSR
ncbi:hypothetical protein AVEN_272184-1 [Araneus ventricosus]|uniref:Uncharacterized protein n=1 Tax=Araneus ventricosus TaxID=182803 RepID=A0A4Y2HWN3_ARAVE|nr:hypothetical protein AVEN_272184-1 [Araneus ventricosus]